MCPMLASPLTVSCRGVLIPLTLWFERALFHQIVHGAQGCALRVIALLAVVGS